MHPLTNGSLAVDGRAYILQAVPYPDKRFGMPDHQIAPVFECAAQPLDHILLGGFIEIHHDVAAENHLERPRLAERLDQIDALELDRARDLGLHLELPR